MAYPRVYNDPENFDIRERPSDRRLKTYAMTQCVLTVLFGMIIAPVSYVIIGGSPKGFISIIFAVIGAVVALLIFRSSHFKRAGKKKAEFIAAGGDPEGITMWMFGSMPGTRLPDGRWEWISPPSDYGDGGVSI